MKKSTKVKIMELLQNHQNMEFTISDIVNKTEMSQSPVRNALQKLCDTNSSIKCRGNRGQIKFYHFDSGEGVDPVLFNDEKKIRASFRYPVKYDDPIFKPKKIEKKFLFFIKNKIIEYVQKVKVVDIDGLRKYVRDHYLHKIYSIPVQRKDDFIFYCLNQLYRDRENKLEIQNNYIRTLEEKV